MSRYIGNVSAYAYAVEKGYTGTEEEFALLMASYATVGQTAVEAAQTATTKASEASQSATTAINKASEATTATQTATNKAAEAQTSARTASTKASEASTAATAAQTARTQTEQSASQALTDIAAARSGAISAVQTEGVTQTANATAQAQAAAQSATTASTKASEASASATTATTKATEAAASATSAAQSASDAQDVLDSIPADYSDLSADVEKLETDLGDLENLDTTDKSNLVAAINEVAHTGGADAVSLLKEQIYNSYPNVEAETGSIVNISDGADGIPLKSLVVDINHIQDLHGQDAPYPAGGGKNLLNASAGSDSSNGVTYTKNENGTYTVNGTANGASSFVVGSIELTANTKYVVSGCPSAGSGSSYNVRIRDANYIALGFDAGSGATITPTETKTYYYQITVTSGYSVSNLVFKPMICLSTAPNPDYAHFAPYSNICPITGWMGMQLSTSGKDTSNPTVKAISWETEAGTVYGGTLDVVSGVLTVNMAYKMFDGIHDGTWHYSEQGARKRCYINLSGAKPFSTRLRGNFISVETENVGYPAIYKAAINNTPTLLVGVPSDITGVDDWTAYLTNNNLQIAYELAESLTYQLTPQEVSSLLGINNIWADTGDASVEYRADTVLYTDKVKKAQSAMIAPVETAYTATRNYTVNQLLIVDNTLYKVTANIANNGTITPDSNVVATTLSEVIASLS